jgi:hypothetical protein
MRRSRGLGDVYKRQGQDSFHARSLMGAISIKRAEKYVHLL